MVVALGRAARTRRRHQADKFRVLRYSTVQCAARDLAYNPEHHEKTKHIERRHFYVRELVENGELIVPYVNTADNLADFFTKPLPAQQFFPMRNAVMNHTPVAPDVHAAAHRAHACRAGSVRVATRGFRVGGVSEDAATSRSDRAGESDGHVDTTVDSAVTRPSGPFRGPVAPRSACPS